MFVISPMMANFHVYTLVFFTTPSIFETSHYFTPEHFSRQDAQKEANLLLIDRPIDIAKLALISRS